MNKLIKIFVFLLLFVLLINAVQAKEIKAYNYDVIGFDAINLDDETAIKGYTMNLFDDSFLFGITPNLLTGGGRFEFKDIELGPDHGLDLPDGWSVASKVMEFDIKSKDKYDPARPFWLQVKYDQAAVYEKSIYYFDQGKDQWIKIPSKTNEDTGYVRAAFHLPFAKLAVLQNDGIMHEGVASWYAYKDCDCAASPDYPKGTQLRVINIDNQKEVIVTVNDFGPERDIFPERVIDLDVVAFKKIANKRDGLCNVRVEPYIEELEGVDEEEDKEELEDVELDEEEELVELEDQQLTLNN